MKTKITQNIKALILAVVLVAGVGYVSAWTAPQVAPPNGDVAAPINVSGGGENGTTFYSQTKTGALTLMNLFTPSLTVTNSNGTVTGIPNGSVLVANGDNTGLVKWGTASGSGVTLKQCTLSGRSSTGNSWDGFAWTSAECPSGLPTVGCKGAVVYVDSSDDSSGFHVINPGETYYTSINGGTFTPTNGTVATNGALEIKHHQTVGTDYGSVLYTCPN